MPKIRIRALCIYLAILALLVACVIFVRGMTLLRELRINPTWIVSRISQSSLQDDAITVLLLGIGGASHEGPNLTDSITLMRYYPETNTLKSLGIPRDVWIDSLQDKLNAVYAYALDEAPDNPYSFVKQVYKDVFAVDVDYVIVVDFTNFTDIVDLVGGVDVTVPQAFIDPWYPKDGMENAQCEPYDPDFACRYETLVVRKGLQHMNGTVALKFVRSRYAPGDAGSDFSRSTRQQLVLDAVRLRLQKAVKDTDIDLIVRVGSYLQESIPRDIPDREAVAIARTMILRLHQLTIHSSSLSEDMFDVPDMREYGGRYVLLPRAELAGGFQSLIRHLLSETSQFTNPAKD